MSQGAENIDQTSHPLLGALSSWNPSKTTYTYAFAAAGETVDKAGYPGGDDFTRAWTEAEKDNFREAVARMEEVSDLSFTEVGSTSSADLDLQMVDNVPGGYGGYASYGGSTYVVGSASLALLTHELGHSMWLAHPFDGTTLPGVSGAYDVGDNGFNSKYYTVLAYRTGELGEYPTVDLAPATSLGAFDIAALQAMYGANETAHIGDDTYGITSDVWTIWDAGGIDTIDFTSSETDAVVDLRAATLLEEAGGGGWASIADLGGTNVGAYMIAYGAVIENGYSGSGNDTVRGNDADNHLIAGLGDDTVYGGTGNDTLRGAAASDVIDAFTLIEMNDGTTTNRELSTTGFAMPGDVTLDMVLRVESGISGHQQIFSYMPPSGDLVFDLRVWDDSSPYVYAVIKTSPYNYSTLWTGITKAELADGTLHRVTISRDVAYGEFTFYLDGVLQSSGLHRGGEAFVPGGTLSFGQNQGLWSAASGPLQGEIGGIAIYDDILSGAEIAARGVTDLADTNDSRLVNYWQPDASGGIQTLDGEATLTATGEGSVSVEAFRTDNDVLKGQGGDDVIFGYAGNDTLEGGAGADVIDGGDAEDLVFGDDGNDTIAGGGQNDMLRGNKGDDSIDGGLGNDTVYGGGNNDAITGGADDDMLDGEFGNDDIQGNDGNDLILGGDGNDTLNGNSGKDTLQGSTGDDYLYGGDDNDVMDGGGGRDRLFGELGHDDMDGAYGKDTILGGDGNDTISGGDDKDVLKGENDHDVLKGGDDADTLRGNTGDDTLRGNKGNDLLDGGNGNDKHYGGAGADTIMGLDGNDLLDGENNPDLLQGGTGDDTLLGGNGGDSLDGGEGQDILDGGNGNDILTGGGDSDVFVFTNGWGDDTITDFGPGDSEDIDLSLVANITDFVDLQTNHLRDNGGTAEIFDGGNTILLVGLSVANIGTGLLYSEDDFLF